MKNKYFGDINDYKKNGLLRALTGPGKIPTIVCWILTEDDGNSDGRRIGYLNQPEKWRNHDPEVFDYLHLQVIQKSKRDVKTIEEANVLPNCTFFSDIVNDDIKERQRYFQNLLEFSKNSQLIFFDPDNGLEVKSVPLGRKNSSKYLYWEEVTAAYSEGHSLLIYQHIPRRKRSPFIQHTADKLSYNTGVKNILSFCTSHVVYFLLPQQNHEQHFKKQCDMLVESWGQRISVARH